MKGIIIFKGKYGATHQYASWLSAILNIKALVAGTETAEQLKEADYVILGTSIYIGKLQLKNWIEKHQLLLQKKKLYLFLVCGTPVDETEKLQGYITANVPAEIRIRCDCYFYPGKLEFKKLSFIDKLLLTIGAKLARSRGEEIHLEDYNHVKRENLDALVNAVNIQIKTAVAS